MATNYKQHKAKIDKEYSDTLYADYLSGLWGITAGYKYKSLWEIKLTKTILDWQEDYDCSGVLCTRAQLTSGTTLLVYPGFGGSPFPQIGETGGCSVPYVRGGTNAVPQTVVITTAPLSILQFTVGATGGPVAGTFIFTPLVGGIAYLIGKTIDIALGTVLTAGVDYSFNSASGIITLLNGRLFNAAEVYTITSF